MTTIKFPTAHDTAVRAQLIDKDEDTLLLEQIFYDHSSVLKTIADSIETTADSKEDTLLIENILPDLESIDRVLHSLMKNHYNITSLMYKTKNEEKQANIVVNNLNQIIFSHARNVLTPIESYLHHHGYETEVATLRAPSSSEPLVRLFIYWNHL